MITKKQVKIIVGVCVLFLALYVLYYSLPVLISLTSNILSLAVFLVIGIIAIYYFAKWLFK